jgi:hypothetical protein
MTKLAEIRAHVAVGGICVTIQLKSGPTPHRLAGCITPGQAKELARQLLEAATEIEVRGR